MNLLSSDSEWATQLQNLYVLTVLADVRLYRRLQGFIIKDLWLATTGFTTKSELSYTCLAVTLHTALSTMFCRIRRLDATEEKRTSKS